MSRTFKSSRQYTLDRYVDRSKTGTIILAGQIPFLYQIVDQVLHFQVILTNTNSITFDDTGSKPYVFGVYDVICTDGSNVGYVASMLRQFKSTLTAYNFEFDYTKRAKNIFTYLVNFLLTFGIIIRYSAYEGIKSIDFDMPIFGRNGIINKNSDTIVRGNYDNTQRIVKAAHDAYARYADTLLDPTINPNDTFITYQMHGVSDIFVIVAETDGLVVYRSDSPQYEFQKQGFFALSANFMRQSGTYAALAEVQKQLDILPTLSQIPDITATQLPFLSGADVPDIQLVPLEHPMESIGEVQNEKEK